MNTYEARTSGIIEAVNAKTGESDDNLTDAVQTLVDGYGQGGNSDMFQFLVTSQTSTDFHVGE